MFTAMDSLTSPFLQLNVLSAVGLPPQMRYRSALADIWMRSVLLAQALLARASKAT